MLPYGAHHQLSVGSAHNEIIYMYFKVSEEKTSPCMQDQFILKELAISDLAKTNFFTILILF